MIFIYRITPNHKISFTTEHKFPKNIQHFVMCNKVNSYFVNIARGSVSEAPIKRFAGLNQTAVRDVPCRPISPVVLKPHVDHACVRYIRVHEAVYIRDGKSSLPEQYKKKDLILGQDPEIMRPSLHRIAYRNVSDVIVVHVCVLGAIKSGHLTVMVNSSIRPVPGFHHNRYCHAFSTRFRFICVDIKT